MVLGSVDRCSGRNFEVVSVMNPDDVAENISRNIIRRDCCATWPLDDVNQHIIDNVLLQHKYSSSCLSLCLSSEFILEQINGASYGDCPEVEISNFPLNSLWSKWSGSRHHDLNLVAFFLFFSFSSLLVVFHLSFFASKCIYTYACKTWISYMYCGIRPVQIGWSISWGCISQWKKLSLSMDSSEDQDKTDVHAAPIVVSPSSEAFAIK